MALHALTHSTFSGETDRSKDAFPRKLELVPESKNQGRADRKTFVIFLSGVAVIGLLTLLAINTMLAQDAFQLSRLETQATAINDQREAVMKKIATASSPGQLALRAKALGMVSSQSPRFLTIDASTEANSHLFISKSKNSN